MKLEIINDRTFKGGNNLMLDIIILWTLISE